MARGDVNGELYVVEVVKVWICLICYKKIVGGIFISEKIDMRGVRIKPGTLQNNIFSYAFRYTH